MKKYISILLVTCLIISMLPIFSITSKAEIAPEYKVVKHTSTWGTYPFDFTLGGSYYTIENPANIPDSLPLQRWFYTNDNVTFKTIGMSEMYALCLNLGIGVILNPTKLADFSSSFWTAIGGVTDGNNKAQGGLYSDSGIFLGYCLNDISGCYYYENSDLDITVPDEVVDDVYNHFNYFNAQNAPDYFVFYPFSNNTILTNLYTPLTSSQKETFDTQAQQYNFMYGFQYAYDMTHYLLYGSGGRMSGTYSYTNASYLLGYTTTQSDYSRWNNFCFKCVDENKECLSTELKLISDTLQIDTWVYDNQDNLVSFTNYNPSNGASTTYNQDNNVHFKLGSGDNFGSSFNYNKITIYKDPSVKNKFDTQLYYPDSYTTDKYQNYQVNSNNEIQTNTNTVNNSVTYNSNSYSDSNDSFYNYYTDNNYDQSEQITNNTTIINNYYDNGGGDNPDNPDNPENPDGNNTLDEILAAILRFFNAIGDIIGTVLAGIVNMISAVLESIAEITSDITNLSDVFGSLLAWLPDPVPQVLGIGLSLVIIAGVIKFIRG